MLFKLLSNRPQGARVISLMGDGALGARIRAVGVPVFSLGMSRGGMPTLASLRYLREIVRRESPDIAQGWMYHGNLAASLAGWLFGSGMPVVWNVRQTLYDLQHERRFTRWVIRANALLSSRANAIVYNSRTSAAQHEAFGFDASRTNIIPNGFDTDAFRPDAAARAAVRRELKLDDNAILVGLIGRYHPMKDHRNFLHAASLLSKKAPLAHFLLVGQDVDKQNAPLVTTIEELMLTDKVSLLGERTDIAQLNASLDILCSASWAEGFANVIGEAMSCSVPCVVTDVGDSAWIVGQGGVAVPPRSPEALASALAALCGMKAEQRRAIGDKGRRRVIEKFSLAAISSRYQDLYDALNAGLGKRSRREKK